MTRRFPILPAGVLLLAVLGLAIGSRQLVAADDSPAADAPQPFVLVVMDPLAKPLSCPCVKGYAQRDYERLAEKLQVSLQRPVKVVFNESLTSALQEEAQGHADLVIGKCSVVEFDARKNKLHATCLAMLTDKEGLTTQTGLIVVPKDDPAKSPADLKDYRIVFGPEECAEKHSAALALLKRHGVDAPAELETSPACSDGACLILEAGPKHRGAAVISSYARPLLEGCGTVEKGGAARRRPDRTRAVRRSLRIWRRCRPTATPRGRAARSDAGSGAARGPGNSQRLRRGRIAHGGDR